MHPTTFFCGEKYLPLEGFKIITFFSKETTRLSQNVTFSHLLLGTVIPLLHFVSHFADFHYILA
jgi:hypothetical protein